ncbi:MAG: 2,3-bisphosphoglycerate-independent phosphoglycerate mutase [Bdellovibrionales bacterium]|nr:2,3-bisphosphoglycerate-independent phosphoglycerate mutase [Bdellovibrionales bacterium]
MQTPLSHDRAHGRALLIVLDGFGIGESSLTNAIENAQMPFYKELVQRYPHSQLLTHGEAVGLPRGIMGNSEVGHTTMGAGRIIYQDLTRISKEIQEKRFFQNEVLRRTISTGAAKTGRVHLMGLLSDGGVHSTIEHLLALLDLCLELQVPRVFVHAFLDGRDTPPTSSPRYVEQLLKHPAFSKNAQLASVMGRFYGMDRDKRWDRTEKAYHTLCGVTEKPDLTKKASLAQALQVISSSHASGVTDEFLLPVLLDQDGALKDGDSLVFFNYRSDRARQMSAALTQESFDGFKRSPQIQLSAFCGMAVYDEKLSLPAAYLQQNLDHLFGAWLEKHGLGQFRIAETEKYAHVTFFFNGGREQPFSGEERLLVPSPRDVATYDLKPEMSAFTVAEEARKQIVSGKYPFVLMNFANADMVGHTGNYEATVRAMEALDRCLSTVIGAAEKNGYHVLITADHGNAEQMCDEHGEPHTQHTLNPVPAIWIPPGSANGPKALRKRLHDGTLADIMPTLCDLMQLPIPTEVTGKSLLPR